MSGKTYFFHKTAIFRQVYCNTIFVRGLQHMENVDSVNELEYIFKNEYKMLHFVNLIFLKTKMKERK